MDIPWIPEPAAQLIIQQFDGFQPTKIAPAFVSEAAAAGLSLRDLTTDIAVERTPGKHSRPRLIAILIIAAGVATAIAFLYRSSRLHK